MKESVPNISVVIPVYNAKKYLFRCLDSVFNQQFSGMFEVIAVEDASTDGSLQMLKSYQDKTPQLKIIEHGVNKSLAIARATGMNASTGDYIMHVDQDDWLLPGAFENIFRKCLETDADALVFNYVSENNKGKRTLVDRIKKELITTDKVQAQPHFLTTAWNKIVKRSITENMIYGNTKVNITEDLLYATEILLKASKIYLIPESYYVYFTNTESMTWQIKSGDYIRNQVIILQQLQRIVDRYEPTSQCINTILNYFEKFIYLEFAKIQLLNIENIQDYVPLVGELARSPIMTNSRTTQLGNSLNNMARCLVEVAKRYGVISTVRLILSCFKQKITSLSVKPTETT